mgnify:FL=1
MVITILKSTKLLEANHSLLLVGRLLLRQILINKWTELYTLIHVHSKVLQAHHWHLRVLVTTVTMSLLVKFQKSKQKDLLRMTQQHQMVKYTLNWRVIHHSQTTTQFQLRLNHQLMWTITSRKWMILSLHLNHNLSLPLLQTRNPSQK